MARCASSSLCGHDPEGSRPEDQCPITVLDAAYDIWAKGIAITWTLVLGSAAIRFRSQSGTPHLARLLQDLITLQCGRGQSLWLVLFDVEKCFLSLSW